MTVNKRPRGRRLALAGCVLLGLGGFGAAGAQAQVQAFDPELLYPRDLTSGPDGALWMTGGHGPTTPLSRMTTTGQSERIDVDDDSAPRASMGIVPLADGGVALITAGDGPQRSVRRLVSVRSGMSPRVRKLPVGVGSRGAVAIGPDRSVWFARSCDDVLGRVTPHGRVERRRLPRLGCLRVDDRVGVERSSVIRLGSDGSVWLVNRCQGRIVRLRHDGRIRQWRLAPLCDADPETGEQRPSRALAEPDGGLRVERARVSAGGALRVGAGIVVPDVVTADGSEWWVQPGATQVVRRGSDGARQAVQVAEPGGAVIKATPAASGGLAVLVAGPDQGGYSRSAAVDVVVVSGDAVRARTRLAESVSAFDWPSLSLTAGPDGALWAADPSYEASAAEPVRSLLRVPDLASPPRPRASLARVIGRDGARIWLQVTCAAPPGALCNGTVALRQRGRGSLLRTTPRYVAAGGMPVTVAAELTRRARRALQRRGALHARATVTSRSATVHRNLEIVR